MTMTLAQALETEARYIPYVFVRTTEDGDIDLSPPEDRENLREVGTPMRISDLLARLTPEQRRMPVTLMWGDPTGLSILPAKADGTDIVTPEGAPAAPIALLAFSPACLAALPGGRLADVWERWVGSQTPAEFYYLALEEGCRTPDEAAATYVADVPHMFDLDPAEVPPTLADDLAEYLRYALGLDT